MFPRYLAIQNKYNSNYNYKCNNLFLLPRIHTCVFTECMFSQFYHIKSCHCSGGNQNISRHLCPYILILSLGIKLAQSFEDKLLEHSLHIITLSQINSLWYNFELYENYHQNFHLVVFCLVFSSSHKYHYLLCWNFKQHCMKSSASIW